MNYRTVLLFSLITIFFCCPSLIMADDIGNDGIGIDDGIPMDDTLTPDINLTYIKRYAISKAKNLGSTSTSSLSGDAGLAYEDIVNSNLGGVDLGPGSIVEGDIYIIIDADQLSAIDAN